MTSEIGAARGKATVRAAKVGREARSSQDERAFSFRLRTPALSGSIPAGVGHRRGTLDQSFRLEPNPEGLVGVDARRTSRLPSYDEGNSLDRRGALQQFAAAAFEEADLR